MKLISAKTADGAWQQAVNTLLNDSEYFHQGRNGKTLEIIPCVFNIKYPQNRWILARNPVINPAYALVEFFWLMTGQNESKVLNYWNPSLPKYAGYDDHYHGAYGHRLRSAFGIDQIQRAYHALSVCPESRQVALQIWNPYLDLPSSTGDPNSSDIPCNMLSLLKIRDGQLYWTQIMRSNDIMRGFPYDVIQFTLLQEFMASWLDVKLGNYIHIADSLHAYEADLDKFTCDSKEDAASLQKALSFSSYIETNHQLSDIYQLLSKFVESKRSEKELKETFDGNGSLHIEKDDFFKDALAVIGSDAARRNKYFHLANELIDSCNHIEMKKVARSWLTQNEVVNEYG